MACVRPSAALAVATRGGAGFPEASRPAQTAVKDIMSEGPVVWCNSADSCEAAATLMLEKNVGLLPVKDAATNFLVGVVTDRDLIVRIVAKGLHASATPVGIALSGPAVAMVYEDADLAAAERLMIDRGVRRVLVSRRSDNLLVGVLSVDDFAMAGFRRRAGEILRAAAPGVAPVRGFDFALITGAASAPSVQAPAATPSVYTVRDVMSGLPEIARASETCRDAAIKMEARSVGFIVVRSDDDPGHVCGVITDRDIVVRVLARNLLPEQVTVGEAMSAVVAACHSDANLADAERLMIERGVRRLPVLDRGAGALVGVVSVDDIALAASRSRAGRVVENAAQVACIDDWAEAARAKDAPVAPPQAAAAASIDIATREIGAA